MVFGGKHKNWVKCSCRGIPAAQALAHDLAIEQVHDGAQIERTISTGDPGDIGDQFLTRTRSKKVPVEDIRRTLTIRQPYAMALPIPVCRMTTQTNPRPHQVLPHDSGNSFVVDRLLPLFGKCMRHSLGTVAVAYFFLDLSYLLRQLCIPIVSEWPARTGSNHFWIHER